MPGTSTSAVCEVPGSATAASGAHGRSSFVTRAAAALVVAAALTGCSGSDAPVVSATDVTATTPPPVTATVEPSPTAATSSEPPPVTPSVAPTVTATSASPAPTSTRPTAPSPQPSSATPTATSGDDAAAPRTQWPPALGEPAQGDPVWAVYLATGHSSQDATIDQAVSDAAAVGYDAVVGDLACDQGALDALQLDPHDFWTAATLYFATERDVNDFLASYRARVGEVEGYARVSLGCLD